MRQAMDAITAKRAEPPRHPSAPMLAPPSDDPNLYGLNLKLCAPDGDDSARAMAQVMRAIVHDSDRHRYIPLLAGKMLDQAKQRVKTPTVEAIAGRLSQTSCTISRLVELHHFLRATQSFTKDPDKVDMPRHVDQLAFEILTRGSTACDCDCIAMLGAAIARAWGFETAFVLVGDAPDDRLRHVFYAVKLKGDWRPFDPQTKTPPFVWPLRAVRREIVPVDA